MCKKRKKNTYSGQGDLKLILDGRQLLNLRIIHSGCKTKFTNVEKEIRLNKLTLKDIFMSIKGSQNRAT